MLKEFALGTALAAVAFQKEKIQKQNSVTSQDERIHDFGEGDNDIHFVRVLSTKLPQPEILVLLFPRHVGWF